MVEEEVVVVVTENSAPGFSTPLSVFQVIYKTVDASSWTYSLPSTTDPDGDTVQVAVDLGVASTFLSYKSDTLTIEDLADSTVVAGSYQVSVTLDDSKETVTS